LDIISTTAPWTGKVVRDLQQQQWANRYGTAFPFPIKMFLAAAVAVAYTQRIWTTLKRKPIALSGLGAIFNATNDATAFLSWEMLSKAKIATFLALIAW